MFTSSIENHISKYLSYSERYIILSFLITLFSTEKIKANSHGTNRRKQTLVVVYDVAVVYLTTCDLTFSLPLKKNKQEERFQNISMCRRAQVCC